VKLSQSNTLDALRRVQGFLDAQAAALGPIIPASLRARLDGAVSSLTGFQTEQNTADSTAHGEAVNQTELRKTFVTQFMEPIGHIAKGALKTSTDYAALSVASSRLRKSDFLGAAQAMADAAAKYQATFTTGGMPADFLTQLNAAIATLTASKVAQDRAVSRRAAATTGIAATDQTAKQIIGVLNGVIAPALATNSPLLKDWESTKRISPAATPLPSQPTGIPVAGTSTPTPTPAPVVSDPVVPPAAETAAPPAPTTTAAAVPTDPQATKPAA
jgi:hypothetical protein